MSDNECELVWTSVQYDLAELIKAAGRLERVMEVHINAVALRLIF
jgi:hypothetical protein